MEGVIDHRRGGVSAPDLSSYRSALPKGAACARVTFRIPPFPFSTLDEVFNRLGEKDVCALDLAWCDSCVGASCRPDFWVLRNPGSTRLAHGRGGACPSSFHIFQTPRRLGDGLALRPRHINGSVGCVPCVLPARRGLTHLVVRRIWTRVVLNPASHVDV